MKLNTINLSLAQLDYLPDSAHVRPKVCAQALGIAISTFWRLVRDGKIKTHKLTRRTTTVRVSDLRAFMNSRVES